MTTGIAHGPFSRVWFMTTDDRLRAHPPQSACPVHEQSSSRNSGTCPAQASWAQPYPAYPGMPNAPHVQPSAGGAAVYVQPQNVLLTSEALKEQRKREKKAHKKAMKHNKDKHHKDGHHKHGKKHKHHHLHVGFDGISSSSSSS